MKPRAKVDAVCGGWITIRFERTSALVLTPATVAPNIPKTLKR